MSNTACLTLVVRQKGEKHVMKPSGHPIYNKFFQWNNVSMLAFYLNVNGKVDYGKLLQSHS